MKVPRDQRKRVDRDHLAHVGRAARLIKLLDRIDNLQGVAAAEPDFQRLYAGESLQLVAVMGDADPGLRDELIGLARRLAD